ncbi:hypothetical protein [Proteiniphilum sp.]|uniref:hypothetical protein n=1 Tax=Proteiniphilum sp. TaxID=1926877 RepID=UPI002B20DFFB|nr:hypothetical protein [Proteiniphilum sp.]MEA4918155.1 hypothetical protein [Proteiniphilum sp.]
MLADKELELLRLINDAEERLDRITFHDNLNEIDSFRNEYGEAFETLLKKRYVYGWIGTYCELSMTEKGREVLSGHQKMQEESSRHQEKIKMDKRTQIWTIISVIIAIIGLLIALFRNKIG